MTTIKNHLIPALSDDARPRERSLDSDRSGPGSAVEFDRTGTNARRLYEQTRLDSERERAHRLASLRAAIKDGSYRPNLEVVAERLAVDLQVGGDT